MSGVCLVLHRSFLAPGYDEGAEGLTQQQERKQEAHRNNCWVSTWLNSGTGNRRWTHLQELQPGKCSKFASEDDVVLPHDLSQRLTVQQVLQGLQGVGEIKGVGGYTKLPHQHGYAAGKPTTDTIATVDHSTCPLSASRGLQGVLCSITQRTADPCA